jgi:hypothetical protein
VPFVYDNLIATVVGATVLLILASIQMRATKTSVAQSARSMALKEAETFATWMEQDLEAMGRNLEDDETVFTVHDRTPDEDSPTGYTLFDDEDEGQSDLTFSYRETTVEYDVVKEEKEIDGKTRTLYQLNRIPDGGSSSILGYFDIRFINGDAQKTTNKDKIRAIRVHFSVVSPFQNDETAIHEVHRMVVVPYTPALN